MTAPDVERGGAVLGRRPVWLGGALGGILLRPWLDKAILSAMVGSYFPLSRLWAAAELAGGDPDRLAAETPMRPAKGRARDRLRRALLDVAARRAAAAEAENRWRDALFGASGEDGRRRAERERRAASARYMAGRSRFRAWRRNAPPVLFTPRGPEHAHRHFGEHRGNPAGLFRAAEASVEVSAAVSGHGLVERWVRFDSPCGGAGDIAWAHVFEPEDGYDHTVVLCHGIGMEAEVLAHGLHMAPALVERGIRVVEPEAPWHSRRRPPGRHGGEPFMALGPVGALGMFAAHVREIATLIGWARDAGRGRVGVGGVSLGALNSQLAVRHAASWPDRMRPDAALLVTTTERLGDLAWNSGFSRGLGAAGELIRAGWTPERLDEWTPLLAPVGEPSIDPGRIVVALGTADDIMPYAGGRSLARRWRIPPENLFESWQGHFSKALGLGRDPAPYARLAAILRS